MLADKLKSYNLILASGSPRRREILEAAELPFVIAEKYHVDEAPPAALAAVDVPLYVALKKSTEYPKPLSAVDILLTADTVVVLDDEVIGKPEAGRALETLKRLNGRTHTVITGVVLRSHTRTETFVDATRVTFAMLTDDELRQYAEKHQPYDKAGAYGVQEWIGAVAVETLEGSYHNVMGLPMQKLYQKLQDFIK